MLLTLLLISIIVSLPAWVSALIGLMVLAELAIIRIEKHRSAAKDFSVEIDGNFLRSVEKFRGNTNEITAKSEFDRWHDDCNTKSQRKAE